MNTGGKRLKTAFLEMITMMNLKLSNRPLTLLLSVCLAAGLAAGYSGEDKTKQAKTAAAPMTFVFGDTTFNPENEEPNVNPHFKYAGWAAMRYGVGETLFRYSNKMQIEPWLAASYELLDPLTWKLTLREGIAFSNGRPMTGAAVKACLEHLVQVHDRAQGDLMIDSISAEGQTVTIKTKRPNPTLLNYLSDPYGIIFDMEAGITDDGIVVGTGPYKVTKLVSGETIELVRNEKYWNGTPGFDQVKVLTISDGDTLAMALQSGEIDGAYGMPYASYPIFQKGGYTFTSTPTSRTFFAHMNFKSPIVQDPAVRKAIAMGVDKERFVRDLLNGNGYAAKGAFPSTFAFGGDAVKAKPYNPDLARATLDAAGWVDSDGDGIRDKNGQPLRIRWLTYPSRQEQPLLAESAQANLKAIGIDVVINNTADHNSIRVRPELWDIYVSAMVTAPTGDPAYFFTTHALDRSAVNNGHYHSDKLEALARELNDTFDVKKRGELAVQMQQTVLDDDAFIFFSHLKMSMITKDTVVGLTAHPTDFYEITAKLAPAPAKQ